MLTDRDWQEPRSHLFIMRIWAEELGDGRKEWRGKVQHTPSGNIQYFRDLPALAALVEAMLAQAAASPEAAPAPDEVPADGPAAAE